jgi:hypothetical protein
MQSFLNCSISLFLTRPVPSEISPRKEERHSLFSVFLDSGFCMSWAPDGAFKPKGWRESQTRTIRCSRWAELGNTNRGSSETQGQHQWEDLSLIHRIRRDEVSRMFAESIDHSYKEPRLLSSHADPWLVARLAVLSWNP